VPREASVLMPVTEVPVSKASVPKVPDPVVVKSLVPILMSPKPEVMEPALRAPVPVSPVYEPSIRPEGSVPVVRLAALLAPMSPRNCAAVRVSTVLLALMRRKLMAPGFVRVKRLPPTVVAPRLVRAVASLVSSERFSLASR